MPTTPTDVATLITGGTQAKPSALLKGVYATLSNAKSPSSDAGSPAGSDFASLLDSPESEENPAGEQHSEGTGRCVLATEPNVMSTATLQIKGMNCRLVAVATHSVVEATPALGAEAVQGVVPEVSSVVNVPDESTIQPEEQTGSSVQAPREPASGREGKKLGAFLRFCGQSSGALRNPALPSTESKPFDQDEGDSLSLGSRGMKHFSRFGHSRQHGGWQSQTATLPAISILVEAPAIQAQGAVNAVPEEKNSSATLLNLSAVDNAALVALANLAIVQPVISADVSLEVQAISASSSAVEDATADVMVDPQDSNLTSEAANPIALENGQGTAASCQAPAHGLLTHALSHRPMGEFQLPTGDLLPAVENHLVTEDAQPIASENTTMSSLTPELRREVVETVAALLAPLLFSLPGITTDALPVSSTGSGDEAGSTIGESAQRNASITIKVGSQASITLELPHPASVSSDTDTAAVMPSSDQLSGLSEEEQPLLHHMMDQLTAQESPLVDLSALDFRVQLETKIEAAWAKQEPLLTPASSEVLIAPSAEDDVTVSSAVSGQVAGAQVESDAAMPATPPVVQAEQKLPVEAIATVGTPVEVMIELPGLGSLTAQIVSSGSPANAQDKKPADRSGRTEKNAGDSKFSRMLDNSKNNEEEKTFLNPAGESLKAKIEMAGTDVAKPSDNMPAQFTSRRVTVDQLELPPRLTGREFFPTLNDTQNIAASTETATSATPAPVLAHRAVETIANVVDAQRQSSANASSVNLHFKFGGDDLAVRVQMRGGEVQTQFLTDSAELRSALTSEWQIMAGQGGAAGLRLLDPVIMPASANVSSGFGNASQGQNHAQQQAQQHQQGQTAAAFPELRELRRSNRVTTPAAQVVTPRGAVVPSTSQHLTALA